MSRRVGPQSDQPFVKLFRRLTYRFAPWEIWHDFVTMFACALSNLVDKSHYEEREALYLKLIQKYNKQEQEVFPQLAAEVVFALEKNLEQDFLGKIFMELDLGNKRKGQFFTPYSVCKMIAEMAVGNIVPHVEKYGYSTINDPACGSGAALIAGVHAAAKSLKEAGLNWQNHVLVAAQDIDHTMSMMCYIQLSLLGVVGYIKIGNTLTEPMHSNDTRENYWFTPMYFSNVWAARRLFDGKTQL